MAAEYVGVKLEVPSDFTMGVDNKSSEFLKLSPAGKVRSSTSPGDRCRLTAVYSIAGR